MPLSLVANSSAYSSARHRRAAGGLLLAALLGVCALIPAWAAPESKARAAGFNERVKRYVVHDEETIRIDNVRVVDGTGAAAAPGQSILIKGGKIAAMGSGDSVGKLAADTVIDGHGRTVMPGLVMLHEHLFFLDALAEAPTYTSEAFFAPKAYLAWGATTIRTAGTFDGNVDLQVAHQIDAGQLVGPRVFVTAPFIEGPGSFSYQMTPITDPEVARKTANFWMDSGATSFKFYMNVSRSVMAAVIEAAHKRGIKVTGHLCSVTQAEAADLGIDDLEHGIFAASDFMPDKAPDLCPNKGDNLESLVTLKPDGPEVKRLIAKLVERKVAVTSTMAVIAAGVDDWFPPGSDLEMLNTHAQTKALERLAGLYRSPERREKLLKRLKLEMAFEKQFVDAGGVLLVGTDPTGWGGTLPGPGNHAAIRLLVEAGFTPLQAIHIATQNGAKFLGVDGEAGTLATGKQADLLLISGNPDEDIRQLDKIDLVFKGGVAFDSKMLRSSLKGVIGR
jgi:imidazolonepropionase-like amidohydrolase